MESSQSTSRESQTSTQPVIAARHLGKTYRSGKLEVAALRDVTFTVDAGEFVAIVGPSGSGKSTLFYVLGGLTSATSGSLFIQGKDFSRLNDAERTTLRRSQIGFVFQRFNLLPTRPSPPVPTLSWRTTLRRRARRTARPSMKHS
jgi:putative ABC transport system ATP-binding protein